MKCFSFYSYDKKDESKNSKLVLVQSTNSALTNHEVGKCGEFDSQHVQELARNPLVGPHFLVCLKDPVISEFL